MASRTFAWRLVATAALAAVVACDIGYEVDAEKFCRLAPSDPYCASLGGNGGTAGLSGAGGEPMEGTGGAPLMGSGGVGGTGGIGGSGGAACTMPKVECGGTCIDIAGTDAKHCGACDRDCGPSAACSAGACVPSEVSSAQLAPYGLTVGAQDLYWSSPAKSSGDQDPPAVSARKKDGSGNVRSAFEIGATPVRLRARSLTLSDDGRFLFWGSLNDNAIYRGDLQATPFPSAVAIEGGEGDVRHLTFAAPKVYWVSQGTASVRGKNPADGEDVFDPNLTGQQSLQWLAVDSQGGGLAYWVADDAGRRIRRQKPGGAVGEVETFATGAPQSVEVHEGVVYWGDRAAGAIRSAETRTDVSAMPAAGEVRVGPPEAEGLEGFAVDAGPPARLYWVRLNGSSTPKTLEVWRANLADGGEKLLLGRVAVKDQAYAGNPFGATHVRVDATHLYFADVGTVDAQQIVPVSQGDGVVYRVVK